MVSLTPDMPPASKMAIVLVNWNGWRDTIECLESILKNNSDDYHVIICDNASTDGSFEKIIRWAGGEERVVPASDAMVSYSTPAAAKPVALKCIDEDGNESGDHHAKLILMQTGANLGFAGGNNVGLRYALAESGCEYFWLLNNDTVIAPDAISNFITHLGEVKNLGMCGTRIHFYHQPGIIQALGGAKFNSWTGNSVCIANYESVDIDVDDSVVISKIDFIVGASMGVTRAFLEEVGLMQESYFLYYEEIDWAQRARGAYALGYAGKVTVFHKEGGAIGSSSVKGERSPMSEYYLMSSRLKYAAQFSPFKLPSILLYAAGQIMVRLCRGMPHLAKAIAFAIIKKPYADHHFLRD